jgi:hypothetical protein
MIGGVHIEVLLAGGYALLLVSSALILEILARHSHRRSEHYRHAGFVYRQKLDVWECPGGHKLTREQTDIERKIAQYRAPAHQCNACHLKKDCTDSNDGRVLESRLDAWLRSEMSRFHRGISLALLLLAVLFLLAEMFRHQEPRDWMVLVALVVPIGLAGSRYLVCFSEETPKK